MAVHKMASLSQVGPKSESLFGKFLNENRPRRGTQKWSARARGAIAVADAQ